MHTRFREVKILQIFLQSKSTYTYFRKVRVLQIFLEYFLNWSFHNFHQYQVFFLNSYIALLHYVEPKPKSPKQILPHVVIWIVSRFYIYRILKYLTKIEIAFVKNYLTLPLLEFAFPIFRRLIKSRLFVLKNRWTCLIWNSTSTNSFSVEDEIYF